MKSLVVAAALVIGTGGGYAFAGTGTDARFQLAALPPELQVPADEGASFDWDRPGKPQGERAVPSAGDEADEDVTGSIARPDDDVEERAGKSARPSEQRDVDKREHEDDEITGSIAPDRDEATDVRGKVAGKPDEEDERSERSPSYSNEEHTGSIDRSTDRVGKGGMPGPSAGDVDEDDREYGDEPGKPDGEMDSD